MILQTSAKCQFNPHEGPLQVHTSRSGDDTSTRLLLHSQTDSLTSSERNIYSCQKIDLTCLLRTAYTIF